MFLPLVVIRNNDKYGFVASLKTVFFVYMFVVLFVVFFIVTFGADTIDPRTSTVRDTLKLL